jgi:tetratricopeptide (TPR) repeat protein
VELDGPDADLLRTAMASIDSDEVAAGQGLDGLPDLGEEPVAMMSAPVEPLDLPAPPEAEVPPTGVLPAAVDLSDELEEADFFAQQGFLTDAHDALLQLRARHPGHPVVDSRLGDVERRLAARAAPPPAAWSPARSPGPDQAGSPASSPSSDELRATRQTPTLIEPLAAGGETIDLGADLAEVLDQAPDLGGGDDEFQYSVEDVFNQFKRGVAETVTPEDSETHYDLGIAYKEMGLVDDAVNEFEVALRGNNRKKEIDSLSMIAACRLDQGRPGDAIEPLRRALRSDYLTKESAKALHYELGLAHAALDEGEQALWCFQKVARTDPGYRDVAGRIAALGGGPGRPPAGMGPASRPVVGPGRPGAIPVASPRAASPAAAASQAPVASPPGPKKNIGFL